MESFAVNIEGATNIFVYDHVFCNFKGWYTSFLSGTDNDVEDFVWWSHGNIISMVGISVTIIIASGFLIHGLSNLVLNCCVQGVCNQVIAHPRMWHACNNAIAITQWTMTPWHRNVFRITDPFGRTDSTNERQAMWNVMLALLQAWSNCQVFVYLIRHDAHITLL